VTDDADYAFHLLLRLQSISLGLLSLLWSPGFLVTFLVTPITLGPVRLFVIGRDPRIARLNRWAGTTR
jgi:hypothetical protein